MGLFSSKKSKNKYATVAAKSKLTVDVVDDNKWKKCSKCNEIIYNEDLKNIKGFGDSIVKNVNEENLVEDKIKEVKSEKKEKIEENLNKKIEEKTSKTKAKN